MKLPLLHKIEKKICKAIKGKWTGQAQVIDQLQSQNINLKREKDTLHGQVQKLTSQLDIIQRRIRQMSFLGLVETYNMLCDDFSRTTFLNIVRYRLGEGQHILPNMFRGRLDALDKIREQGDHSKTMKRWTVELSLYSLDFLGRKIKLYTTPLWIYLGVLANQYEYNHDGNHFKAVEGDYVIDGGAFYGDSAVVFADDVGEHGRVYSFEFMPDNVEMWNMNVGLNPHLADRMKLVENALWSKSGETLYISGAGPETKCSSEYIEGAKTVKTQSIDEFMLIHSVPKMDMIKLDIEGGELETLNGAAETIRKFKPKLAICVYHKDDDLVTIPQYIKSLVPEYKMFLKHHTHGIQETVLYAML